MKTLLSNPNFYLKPAFRILLVVFFAFFGISSFAQTSIWTNPITGTNPGASNPYTTGQTVNSLITVSGIGRTGVNNISANNVYNADAWGTTGTINTGKYYSFTLTPATGYKISLSSFVYTGTRETGGGSNAGPTSFALRSNASSDNYATNIGTPSATGTTVSLSAAAYQDLSAATGFRYYAWNAGGNGEYSINDFTFNGTVLGSATTALTFGSNTYGTAPVQTFQVNGSGLNPTTATITINGSTNYEVSTTSSSSGFGATATLTASGGSLSGANVWVRLKATSAVGTYNENITFGGGGVTGVTIVCTGTITTAPLTLTGLTADNKSYDGLTTATLSGTATYVGLQNGESFSVTGTPIASFATANVGTGIAVTVTGYTAPSSNYTVSQPTGLTANIITRSLTITANNGSKTYGQTFTTGSGSTLFSSSGLQNSETIGSITIASSGAVNTASVTTYSIVPSAAIGGTFTASNYAITYTNGSLTVNTAPLTITANNGSKTYGQTFTTGSGSILFSSSGLQNSETIGSITIASSGAVNTASVTTYSIVPSAATGGSFTASNYNITYTNGTLTVNTSPLTINGLTADNKSYDGLTTATLSGTAAYVGLQNGESFSVTGSPSASFATANVGTGIAVTVTGYTAPSSNYTVSQPTGLTADISTVNLTINGLTADNKSYDGLTTATLSGTAAYVGLQNGESFSVTGSPSASFATANVGTGIAVTVTGYTAPSSNYTVSQPTGLTADISTVNLTINGLTADNKSYDGLTTATLSGTAAYVGLQNGESFSVTGSPSASFATANVGTGIAVTVTGYTAPSSNYTVSQPTGLTADITTASLTITANDATKIYGQTFTVGAGSTAFTSSSLQNSETIGSITIASSGAVNTASVGNYSIIASAATGGTFTASNYDITYVDGTLEVTPASLTITADDTTKVYGSTQSTPTIGATTFSSVGLQNTDAIDSVTLTYGLGAIVATDAVGSISTITPSAAIGSSFTAGNYDITYVDGTLEVTPAALTITADDETKVYGIAQSTPVTGSTTFSSSGLQNSDAIDFVTLTYSSGAIASTDAVGSTSTITPSAAVGGSFTATNYTITYVSGTLEVTPASLTITADDGTKIYGQTFTVGSGSTAFSSIGLQNSETIGTITIASSGAVNTASVANYSIVASAATGGTFTASNYAITYVDGTLEVTPAPLTVTADDTTKVYGTTQSTPVTGAITFSSVGLQNTDAIDSVTLTYGSGALAATDVVGSTSTITPSAAIGSSFTAGNYDITYVDGTLEVTPASLTITADDATKCLGTTYTLGTTAFTSSGLQNSETIGSVTLTSVGDDSGALSGNYPIEISDAIGGTFTATNYTITYVDGTIYVQTVPTEGSIGSAQSICINTTPLPLTSEEFGDGDGVVTYRWEFNTDLNTPSWSTISGETLPTYTPGVLTQTTQYRRFTISTLNGVACESIPTPVIQVTIIPLPVVGTIGGGNISLCSGTNSVTLTLTGYVGNILWHYAVSEEGYYRPIWGQTSPTLVRSNFTGNSTTYFFAQVTNECTTTIYPYSNKIAVTVSKAVAGTITGAGTVCTGSTRTLTSTSSVGTLQWQSSPDNGVTPFADISGATGITYTTDPLTTPMYYRVVATAGICGSATSASVVVNVSSLADAGSILEGDIVICKGSSAPLTLTGNTAGTIAWLKSTNATSITPTWTVVSGQNTTILTSGLLTVTTWYKARVTNGSCVDETPIVQVTVNPTSVVRSIAGTGTICSGSSRLLTLGIGSVGTLQWYSSTTSATANDFSPISGATGETYLASPTVTTWYVVQATSGLCAPVTSAAIVVRVDQPAVVGTVTATTPTLCASTGTTITLSSANGTIAWQRATVTNGIPDAFVTVSGTTASLSTGLLTSSRAYRAVVTSGVCTQKATSNVAIVSVIPAAKVAAISGFNTATTKTCVGTPRTLTLGTGYVGTIEWLSSPTLTGVYTVIPGETATTYVYTPSVAGVMYFKVRTTSSPCTAQALTATGVAVHADTTNCTRQSAEIVSNEFEVKAYPNPSSSDFTIETSAKGTMSVQVYDMQGRLVENTNSSQVGSKLAAGTYNVIVNQGAKTKKLRVIKK